MKQSLILAIDTSADDTSAAVTQGTRVLSNVIASQTELHKQYGGIFPTVAKLAHKENIAPTVAAALKRARVAEKDIDAVAVTQGPGLAPALEVGISFAKELTKKWNVPLIPVNHVEGHLLSAIAQPPSAIIKMPLSYPALGIVVSGGHTSFVLIEESNKYKVLGQTLDDAAGECLDKVGRMLNLGYPAGAIIEQFSKLGNSKAIEFPLPLTTVKTFDVSFSGLKTFSRNVLAKKTADQPLTQQEIYNFCASLQYAVFRHICYKISKILEKYSVNEVLLGGGVSANATLRNMLRQPIKKQGLKLKVPYTKRLCMDNAAMIGVVAGMKADPKDKEMEIERQPNLGL